MALLETREAEGYYFLVLLEIITLIIVFSSLVI